MSESKRLNILTTCKTVLWGFFGVRGGQTDIDRLGPVRVIIIAVLGAAILVSVLVFAANQALR